MHPGRIAACAGVLASFSPVVSGPIALHGQAANAPIVTNVTLVQALDRYDLGDRAVLPAIARLSDGTALYLTLQRDGLKWAKARGDAEKPRRLLVMAAFALEAAGNSAVATPIALQLIELACDRLRPPNGPSKPLPAERLWHQAALGVLEAKGNYMAVQAHLWHLDRRFKDEPRALLARAWAKQSEWEAIPGELAAMSMPFDIIVPPGLGGAYRGFVYQSMVRGGMAPAIYGSSGGVSGLFLSGANGPRGPQTTGAPRDITTSIWSRPGHKIKAAGRVIREYEKALAEPSVAPEAHLRLGYLYHVSGKHEQAREHLASARLVTTARDQRYLIELFDGWIDEATGQTDAAEAAYRRALLELPHGRTAVTWLAALLQARGRLDDAQALVDQSLAAAVGIPDPWPMFAQGDFRHWDSTMEKLRGELWAGAPLRSH